MSFLRVGDRAAGAIKSGGTTRRAAKMVILDADHPDIRKFVNWKVEEEKKVAALIAAGYDSSYEGDAYGTVSGQNSNNSVRISDKFIQAVRDDGTWDLLWRRDKTVARTIRARDLWDEIARAAWACADPGIQYDDIINSWHTCPEGGRIRASNPCVTGDTLVATADGLQRIDHLVGKSAFVIGSDGKPHFVNRFFKTGFKPVYALRTKAGYELRLTADHRVLTQNRGDVPARELRPHDKLVLHGSGFGNKHLAEDLAISIGVAVGDGCLRRSAIPVGVASYSEHAARLAFASKPVVEIFERYATLDKGSEGKQFLPTIHELDRSTIAAILRGLFSSDGTVANYNDKSQYVSLDSTSLNLLKQVQLLLLSFGIKAKLYPVQEMHSLRVSRSSRVAFEQEIGFDASSPKAAALSRLNQEGETDRDELTDEVEWIVPAGTAAVYDLTEHDTNHFVANGILVHNCSEYMFLDDTACNLASINLMKFYDAEKNQLDVDAYRHAIRLWTIVLEISVLMAQFPSEIIARKSYEYRTSGWATQISARC